MLISGLLAMLLLIVASGFFSSSETALFCLTRDELRRMKTGTPAERTAAQLMTNPDRLLTSILFWNLVTNLTYFMASLITGKQIASSQNPAVTGLFGIGSVAAIILFGEVGPKGLAVIASKSIAVWASIPLAVAVRALDPIHPFLGTCSQALRRTIWPQLKVEPYLDVEDIERAVDASEQGGDLVALEQKILQRILDFSDLTAEEVMRPRGRFPLLFPPVQLEQVKPLLATNDYLFFAANPEEDLAVSAIPTRDVISLPENGIEKSAEPVVYFPWCGHLADLLRLMRTRVTAAATIVNEYGEMVGVVTEEDLFDTLLNPRASRTRRLLKREPIIAAEDGKLHVDGVTTLRYLAEQLNLDHEPTDDGLLTVTGLFYDTLQRLPQPGDFCDWHSFRITVEKASERGGPISVIMEKIPAETPPG